MDDNNIYSPSFEHEAKTKFFKYDFWGITFLIGIVIVLVLKVLLTIVTSILGLNLVSILAHHWIISILTPTILIVLGSICLARISVLMEISYKIEYHQIIKASIRRDADFTTIDFRDIDLSKVSKKEKGSPIYNAIGDIVGYTNPQEGKTIPSILTSAKLNTIPEFVTRYFSDDNIYAKRIYHNPVLLRETKRHIIYQTDEQKIKIPKIYAGLGQTRYDDNATIKSRITKKLLIFCLVVALISSIDIAIGTHLNSEKIKLSQVEGENIAKKFLEYGYQSEQESGYFKLVLEKEWPFDRSSEILVFYGTDGSVESLDAELYFPYGDKTAIDELKCFVETIPQEFDKIKVAEFYEQFQAKIEGDDNYFKVKSKDGNYILVLIPESKEYFRVYFREN